MQVVVDGDFAGDPGRLRWHPVPVSVDGNRPRAELDQLVELVDRVAEIPNSLRAGTAVTLVANVEDDANGTAGLGGCQLRLRVALRERPSD